MKRKYNFVNVVVIIATAALFICDYRDIGRIFQNKTVIDFGIIVLTAVIVHTIKASRLYLALYGSNISLAKYVKTYCKVTPVSIVFPFKLGEFFRMYCYGGQLGNMLKGLIIVLLDRFMDTIALVTMILLVWILDGGYIMPFVYLLLVFLIFAVVIYYSFPGVYGFWKKYILKTKATEHKLAVLKFLDMLNLIYQEITNVTKGRGALLYFMSLIAWTVEIGSIAILNGLWTKSEWSRTISEYLTSAMSGKQSADLMRFTFVSVLLLIATYIMTKMTEMSVGKKEHNEDYSHIR